MRVLLSTIGSRGDVQPLVALALELRALGQEVRQWGTQEDSTRGRFRHSAWLGLRRRALSDP